ncbi:cyclin Ccl1, putative [Talaromyces stipitatus ATCC 10500]|uniref:Cyclin Ccl1, putative n=1 Tax=Talaromyces stipitatus (strain ATCC 10500 / CBS 375.48 / QM 6759 / NRRL 1006) TaxID=441959 RepID=B8MR55_TALSN|nr:cyclin Ccl1, putative [Talaromyces stipitatus ATCC 10500]EED12950.1 cyclin Ccl1, putative [Talaromyces stipitatus ATCC 10500]
MIEDEIYKTSTQFRIWSFTKESLKSLRANTNAVACEHLRAAQNRAREVPRSATPSTSGNLTPNPSDNEAKAEAALGKDVECLTAEEELMFVSYYCEQALELGDNYKPPLPTMVRATAIQYLRRFYLTNSVMTYHPKTIMPCALFLATKTDNYYLSLNEFAKSVPKIDRPADVIAPEYTLTQALRYTFDVRHPFRGLEGGIMELQAIAQGEGRPGPLNTGQTPEIMKQAINSIEPIPGSDKGSISSRISLAHDNARDILKKAAQMTDAYFFYTPSQIWLSALFIVDKPLAQFYLDAKVGPDVRSGVVDSGNPLEMIRMKLLTTLSDCVSLLESYTPFSANSENLKELKAIAKKVYQCQMIEKLDPAAPGSGQKRSTGISGAEGASESELERVAKKRRLERERREKEGKDIFGGELVARRKKAG